MFHCSYKLTLELETVVKSWSCATSLTLLWEELSSWLSRSKLSLISLIYFIYLISLIYFIYLIFLIYFIYCIYFIYLIYFYMYVFYINTLGIYPKQLVLILSDQ